MKSSDFLLILYTIMRKNSRKYNQYPLSILCKITIYSTFPLIQQNRRSGFMKLGVCGNIIPSKLYLSHRISGQ